MKLDPDYPAEPYLYLLYTYDAPIGGDYTKSTHPHYSDGSTTVWTPNRGKTASSAVVW